MQLDWLNIISSIVTIVGGLWALVFGGKAIVEVLQQRHQKPEQSPKEPGFGLKPLTITNILLGLLVILIGTVAAIFSPQLHQANHLVGVPDPMTSRVGPETVTPTSPTVPVVKTPGVQGADDLLHFFCFAIGNGNYAQAYNFMTETQRSLWEPQQELERWAKCTVPSSSNQIKLVSPIRAYYVIQMFSNDTSVPMRKITLSYTNQEGWKISTYAS